MLTSFRFLAALAVFGLHLSVLAQWQPTAAFYKNVLTEGYAGVTFFFVLSGFILTYSYAPKLRVLSGRKLWDFGSARFVRIAPLHILMFVGVLAVQVREPGMSFGTALLNVSFLHAFVPISSVYHSFNIPSWSLSDEMLFYAVFPFLIFVVNGVLAPLVTPWRIVGVVLTGWALFGVMYATAAGHLPEGTDYWFFYVNPFTRLLDFATGVGLGLLFLDVWPRLSSLLATARGRSIATVAEVLVLAFVGLLLWRHNDVAQNLRWSAYYVGAFAGVIFVFAFAAGRLSQVLSARWLVFMGEASFAFYMVHAPVISFFERTKIGGDNPAVVIGCCSVISVVASIALYMLYEQPMRKRGRRLARTIADRFASRRIASPAVSAVD